MMLITGGAGFIGSNLVGSLLTFCHSVRVLDNLRTGSLQNLLRVQTFGDHFDCCYADIENFDDVLTPTRDVQRIVHLAAQVSVQYSLQHPVNSANCNVTGFFKMLEAARVNKVPRFIHASGAAVYRQPAELPLIEESSVGSTSPCGLVKLINEQYAKLYSEIHGIFFFCLGFRFFNVYGPRQDPKSACAGVISKFFERIASDQPITIFGDGHQTLDFVYVSDVANACAKAIDSMASGVPCVGTGRSINLLQLVAWIEAAVGKNASILHTDPVKGDIVHTSMEPKKLAENLEVAAEISLHDGLRLLWQSLRDGREKQV